MEKITNDSKMLGAFFDDSNNLQSPNPGIVAGTFSDIQDDYKFNSFPRRIPLEDLFSWFKEQPDNRHYRFAKLTHEELRRIQPFIQFFVPDLVKSYLSSCQIIPEKITVFIDGIVGRSYKAYLKDVLGRDFKEVRVENVVKREREMAKRPKQKRIYAPRGLMMADRLANSLYTGEYSQNQDKGYNPEVEVDQFHFLHLAREFG